MLRHSVMFKWNDAASDESKAAIAAGLDELAELAFIAAYTHGPDAGVVDGNWDYAVVADFATEDDYRSYADDPEHRALIANLIKPNISDRAGIQFEV